MNYSFLISFLLLISVQAHSQIVLEADTNKEHQDSLYYSDLMTKYSVGDTLYRSFVYDRTFFGRARKSAVAVIRVVDKSHKKLRVEVLSFGEEKDIETIYNLLDCVSFPIPRPIKIRE